MILYDARHSAGLVCLEFGLLVGLQNHVLSNGRDDFEITTVHVTFVRESDAVIITVIEST